MRGRERHDVVAADAEVIYQQTGHRPPTCPWRTFRDPLVQDVLRVYGSREAGFSEADVGGEWKRAPRIVVEGLVLFDRLFRRCSDDERERLTEERKRQTKPRPSPGG